MYTKNPNLPVIHPTTMGTPKIGNTYQNTKPRKHPGLGDILRWRFSINPQKLEKESDSHRPAWQALNHQDLPSKIGITWLGHSSFLIQSDSCRILIDPVQRFPFMRRLSEPPIDLKSIQNVDYVLISHGHFDHYDAQLIANLQTQKTKALIPLSMGKQIQRDNKNLAYEEAGWWQQFSTQPGLEIIFVPAFHWFRRSLFDQDKVLWGGYIIRINGVTIFYSGDTAYSPHFAEIAQIIGPIDIALLPVGAYKPDYIMQTSHIGPIEAVQAFNDLNAKTMIPCHWGTFDLSDEPPGEPYRLLKQLEQEGLIKGNLIFSGIGETIPFSVAISE